MKKSLTKEELILEFGLGNGQEKKGCTITLDCSFGSISCTSSEGDCKPNYEKFELSDGESYEMVTSITCDGQTFDCKKNL